MSGNATKQRRKPLDRMRECYWLAQVCIDEYEDPLAITCLATLLYERGYGTKRSCAQKQETPE